MLYTNVSFVYILKLVANFTNIIRTIVLIITHCHVEEQHIRTSAYDPTFYFSHSILPSSRNQQTCNRNKVLLSSARRLISARGNTTVPRDLDRECHFSAISREEIAEIEEQRAVEKSTEVFSVDLINAKLRARFSKILDKHQTLARVCAMIDHAAFSPINSEIFLRADGPAISTSSSIPVEN